MTAGSGNSSSSLSVDQAVGADPRLFLSGSPLAVTRTSAAPTPGGFQDGAAANRTPSRPFGAALFEVSSGGGGGASLGGGGFGGAPSPEVNAGLALLLVGATVAILRRRRDRATPRAA
ncbi:hypothetical protein [Methylobacterium sp. SD21]|uniref:hypothetical protein n=1 Tax=Methylobacterium litchii TaxID=3138810 RepID=UPI00313F05E6